MLSGEVAVSRADGEGGGNRDVGEAKTSEYASDKFPTGMGAREAFIHVEMQDGAAGVEALKILLMGECFKRIVSDADGKLGRIRIIRSRFRTGMEDVWEFDPIDAGEAVCGSFRR